MNLQFWNLRGVALCTISLMVGCGGADDGHVRATGTVTYNGAPLAKGEVAFVDEKGVTAAVSHIKDGSFSLEATASHPGINPGKYEVAVSSWNREPGTVDDQGNIVAKGDPAIPEKYMNYKTSGLTATVEESGTSSIKLELSGEPGKK